MHFSSLIQLPLIGKAFVKNIILFTKYELAHHVFFFGCMCIDAACPSKAMIRPSLTETAAFQASNHGR